MQRMLSFGKTVRAPDVRTLYDMTEVIYDKGWLQTAENFDLYFMCREMAQNEEDLRIMREFGLRYDITVIPPAKLGMEYVKTAGHYHPKAPGASVSYSEIYQVLEGEAVYLLQKAGKGGKVADAVVVVAEKGDIVFVPPDYGHITVNKSDKVLKMANWVFRDFSSLYEPIREFGGGAYFLLEDGFARNPNYCFVPEIRRLEPSGAELVGLSKGEDMYVLVENLQNLRFLKEPQTFSGLFAVEV